MKPDRTTVTVERETVLRLRKHGISGQSIDYILNKVLDIVEQKK